MKSPESKLSGTRGHALRAGHADRLGHALLGLSSNEATPMRQVSPAGNSSNDPETFEGNFAGSNWVSTPSTTDANCESICSVSCTPGRSASALSGTCSAFSESLFTAADRMVTHTTSTQSTNNSLKSWGMMGEKVSEWTNGQNLQPAERAFHHVA